MKFKDYFFFALFFCIFLIKVNADESLDYKKTLDDYEAIRTHNDNQTLHPNSMLSFQEAIDDTSNINAFLWIQKESWRIGLPQNILKSWMLLGMRKFPENKNEVRNRH